MSALMHRLAATTPKLKLNLGCGQKRIPGYLGVDLHKGDEVDMVLDLERLAATSRWPWDTGSVDAIVASHSLEHMGQDPRVFIRIIEEMYRVCAPGAIVEIAVPDPRSEQWFIDPTHCRPITIGTMTSFDASWNLLRREMGAGNQNQAWAKMVDFQVLRATQGVARVLKDLPEAIRATALCIPGFVMETRMTLVAHKPIRTVAYPPDYRLETAIEWV